MATGHVIFFPFAGATGRVFHRWLRHVPARLAPWAIDLHSDDRQTTVHTWRNVVSTAASAIQALPALPLYFCGFSMGAALAADAAVAIGGERTITKLVLVAYPAARLTFEISDDDDALLRTMTNTFGPLPQSMHDQAVRQYVMPDLRSDLQLLRTRPPSAPPAAAICIYGREDPSAPFLNDRTQFRLIIGGHFPDDQNMPTVISALTD